MLAKGVRVLEGGRSAPSGYTSSDDEDQW